MGQEVALKNILENCAYLGNLCINIKSPSEEEQKILRLINNRIAQIQQLIHMAKVLEKEGYSEYACMSIMDRVKLFTI